MGVPEPDSETWGAMNFGVGKRYPVKVPVGLEGSHISMDENGLILLTAIPSPTPDEIAYIQADPFEARLEVGFHTLFFVFRMGRGPWTTEAVFSPWRAAAAGHGLFEHPGPGYGIFLQVCLVDTATGILRGMRMLTLSRDFCTAILSGCRSILDRPSDDDAHAREVRTRSQTPLELLAEQATVRFSTDDVKT